MGEGPTRHGASRGRTSSTNKSPGTGRQSHVAFDPRRRVSPGGGGISPGNGHHIESDRTTLLPRLTGQDPGPDLEPSFDPACALSARLHHCGPRERATSRAGEPASRTARHDLVTEADRLTLSLNRGPSCSTHCRPCMESEQQSTKPTGCGAFSAHFTWTTLLLFRRRVSVRNAVSYSGLC
jgi:hypothetical protein